MTEAENLNALRKELFSNTYVRELLLRAAGEEELKLYRASSKEASPHDCHRLSSSALAVRRFISNITQEPK